MPVRRRGYRRWEGELGSHRWTWLAILQNGLRLGMKQKQAALVLWAAIPGALFAGVVFYLLALVARQEQGTVEASRFLRALLQLLRLQGMRGPSVASMIVPTWHLVFFRLVNYQLLLILIVQAKFSADLVAGDLRANALPIYFSKPITVSTYLLGKWLVAFLFASAVTLVPNLLAYAGGLLVSDTLVQLGRTAGLLWRLAALSVVIAGVSSLVTLAISALFRDRRAVAVAWVALILLTSLAQGVFDENAASDVAKGPAGAVSLYRTAMRFSYWVLDIDRAVEASGQRELLAGVAGSDVYGAGTNYACAVLVGLAVVALAICMKRVHRFQVAAVNA
ncbi:MAG: ABC transporter permease subunit [Planctomycetota bacterium]